MPYDSTKLTVALIPARSGSKSIPDKNIRSFLGKPLMVHSIEQALAAESVDRVIVSTDSEVYADIARQHGAEVPFLRPPEISGDASTDLEVFRHALDWLIEHEGSAPQICVHLRPTHPLRRIDDINEVIRLLWEDPDLDSVRSIAPAPETPFKMWFRAQDGLLTSVATLPGVPEAHSTPRQSLPPAYLQNASIDAIRSKTILEKNSMTGNRIHGYVMEGNYDIDDLAQFAMVEQEGVPEHGTSPKQTFCFDIDGVIATLVPGNDYNKSRPRREMIGHVNALFEKGHYIVLNTARGSKTGIDWSETTRRQLAEWGLHYHELHFGKPAADYYVDDRMLPLDKIAALVDDIVPSNKC
ncbi:MAG: acylneuraminate cytidylyltransferase [Nitrospira sp.]|nr:acylneuraminate cytidylyltransferase [Nitrospira sp.]